MQKLFLKKNLSRILFLFLTFNLVSCSSKNSSKDENKALETDKYIWLEEVESKKALSFVADESEQTVQMFTKNDGFKKSYNSILEVLESKDKILYVSRRGEYVYNFWRDSKNVKGLWRRMLFKNYKAGLKSWETLIDFDEFVKKEKKNWVFKGAECFLNSVNTCMVSLSNGGKDATEKREFLLDSKKFVSKAEKAFFIPESKGAITWLNKDEILFSSTADEKEVTESGYPSHVKHLKRGQDFEKAKLVAKTDKKSLGIWASSIKVKSGKLIHYIEENFDFYTRSISLYKGNGQLSKIKVPKTARFLGIFFEDHFFFEASKQETVDGTSFKKGTVFYKVLNSKKGSFSNAQLFFSPTPEVAFKSLSSTKDFLVLKTLDNVISKVSFFNAELKKVLKPKKLLAEFDGKFSIIDSKADSNELIISTSGFLNPSKLKLVNLKTDRVKSLQEEKAYFDSKEYVLEQKFAKSDDGTKVPFFIIRHKNLVYDSKRPTIMYGYGGFQVSLEPWYFKTQVNEWVKKDQVYVVANIRGGGEYGPSWHQSAIKMNKRKSYEDFASVAKKLFDLKITSPKNLGIMGGSNGGLLVGASMTLYPELYGAVFCAVPLLDMIRYHKLPPGASWMAEYGNPDIPEERDYILTYSPYQNIKKDQKYPEALFYTSTFDDRVQPGHARKMYKKMQDMGYMVHYYENSEGGHAGAADLKQRAFKSALSYSYFKSKLE